VALRKGTSAAIDDFRGQKLRHSFRRLRAARRLAGVSGRQNEPPAADRLEFGGVRFAAEYRDERHIVARNTVSTIRLRAAESRRFVFPVHLAARDYCSDSFRQPRRQSLAASQAKVVKTKAQIKKSIGAIVRLMFVLSLAVISVAAQSGRGWMNGFVVEEAVTRGVKNARVELIGSPDYPRLRSTKLEASADENGKYSFAQVPYGRYIFRVSARGFTTYEIKLFVAPDVETKLHVQLMKQDVQLIKKRKKRQ
jgi:hypothetical protein